MNDSIYPTELPVDAVPEDVPPQFGAVDIVEAFTAMRHEWRGQTKESRALAEQIQAAVTNLQSLESKLLAQPANAQSIDGRLDDSADARQFVLLLVDTDQSLSRAVAAISQWEINRRLRDEVDTKAVASYFDGMNPVARWFARPLMTFIAQQRPVLDPQAENPAIDGLNMVLTRLRRVMYEHGIERLDAEGQAFDANTMHAIGTVETSNCPAGHVAEQLSPAYRWQGQLLRFADVRVARVSVKPGLAEI